MKTESVGPVLLWLFVNAAMSFPQQAPDVFQGYEDEWNHVSGQLNSLAEATHGRTIHMAPGDRSLLH